MNAGIDFLEFKPSEIAAAVAISVTGKTLAVDIDKTMSCFVVLEKVKLVVPTYTKPLTITNSSLLYIPNL